jgi:putative membrane protein
MLNHVGERAVGIPSLSLLKAFLLNWILGANEPLEEFLEQLGEEQDVEVSLLRFDATRPKAMVVVPSVHPGPFRNVGSSVLPSMIKKVLEKQLGCTVCVPHGLFGHELDLASQAQNQRLVSRITNPEGFESAEALATPFVSVAKGVATASCQVFGKFAFVSFTLAPHMTEDLPQELGEFARQEATKHGWTCSVVVDAHNSLDGAVNADRALEDLRSATTACFAKASSGKLLPFGIGAATVMPKEFGLQDGMGSGGISVIIVQVGSQRAAYVVIDGNNMVSGLREQILLALRSVGVNEGEVFTTDSHEVSAITLSDRGYSPLGEALDRGKLTDCIVKAALAAIGDLEAAQRARHATVTIPRVKVIGKKRLETLCLLIDKALQRARRSISAIAVVDGLVLMLALMII